MKPLEGRASSLSSCVTAIPDCDSCRAKKDGLEYVDSWIEPNFARCFQLMRCDDPRLFQEWVLQWRGFGVTFEIVPVVASKETQAVVARYLDTSRI